MKRTIPILSILGLLVSGSYAQGSAQPKPAYGWKHNLIGAIAVAQVAFKDWKQGGEDAMAWTFAFEGKSVNDQPKTNGATSYKFAFGQTKLGNQGTRKTDDKIDVETVLTYKLGTYVNPYISATLKTQFAKGFKYNKDGTKTDVSKAFDPAYLTQGAGVGYQLIPQAKTRLGAAVREVVTRTYPNYANNPKTEKIEKTKVEGGFESVTHVEWQLAHNLLLRSKVELFAPLKTLDKVVTRSDNTLAVKVNKYVTVNLNVQVTNDTTSSPRTQIKEALTLGLSYTFM